MSFRISKYLLGIIVGSVLLGGAPAAWADLEQDRAEAIAWLLQNQNGDGSWGQGGAKVATTSEVLEALRNAGVNRGFLYSRALSWLANINADSVDSLARKIIALERANFDSQGMGLIDDLLARRNTTLAWGSFDNYSTGFPDTSLAMQAIFASGVVYSDTATSISRITSAQASGDSGWSFMGESIGRGLQQQIMPSAHNLIALSAYQSQGGNARSRIIRGINWLVDSRQQTDGSFLDDTAAISGAVQNTALAYLAIHAAHQAGVTPAGSDAALSAAQNYLLGQQATYGSWSNDPYRTALALRTFPATVMADIDADGIPDTVETLVGTDPAISDERALITGNGLDPDGLQASELNVSPMMIEILSGEEFSLTPAIFGGTAAYTVYLFSGHLPNGITLQPIAPWAISGATTSTGIFTFTLLVNDAVGNTAMLPGLIRVIDPNDASTDTDNDGFSSSEELARGSDPLDAASIPDLDRDDDGVPDDLDLFPDDEFEWADNDNDGIGNNADTDDDNDGMPDSWEIKYGFNPYNASDAEDDPDIDGLTNAEEYSLGTNPKDADSDRDGMSDGDEVAVGRNPLLNEKGLLLAPIIPMLLEGDDERNTAAILVPIIQLLLGKGSE